jgi:hypothetical protein
MCGTVAEILDIGYGMSRPVIGMIGGQVTSCRGGAWWLFVPPRYWMATCQGCLASILFFWEGGEAPQNLIG